MSVNELQEAVLTLDDIRRRPSLTVEEAGRVLGLGRVVAYRAVRDGSIPSIRIGNRICVPTPRLLALLGEG